MLKRAFARGFSSIKVSLPSSKFHNLEESFLPKEATTTKEELIQYLRDMVTIRRIEITADNYYKNKEIRGFCHLSDGQEAVAVGMEAGATFEDYLITAYRDHGQAYMRGESPHAIFAEMFGRKTGSSKGKGGSMHYYNKETNFYGGNGIVGAQCPVGVGLAFELKYRNKKNCAFVMYGDGASNQGQLYEGANMAGLWKLPAIFICENNLYGMGTSIERSCFNPEIFRRGDRIPGIQIDAQDIFNVRETIKAVKNYSIDNGPVWLEFLTYRYHGHSMSDPGISYRNREEIQSMRAQKDPIEKVKQLLVEHSLSSEQELKDIEKEVRQAVNEAAKKALEDPFPEDHELYTDIYHPSSKILLRNVEYHESTTSH
mmetsp:Transcript_5908/g.8765  ORF Transcript_5908/g.8765 Transcript_5908/m.8765 type:complete len:371 (+) Transcript_5908:17-1129(+)